jgi:hypothetical protein
VVQVRLARALLLVVLLIAAAPQAARAAAPFTPWCGGGEEAAADRQPDAVSAFQIHVVYALPSDGTDRFAERVSLIDTDAAAMDVWWRGQDPTRTPRFDLHTFSACASIFGQLDVSFARLPHDGAFYGSTGEQYRLIRSDLDAAGFGDPDKKYLVYYDGPALAKGAGVVCGQSETGITEGGPSAYSIVYLGDFCASGLGVGGVATVTATHELIHGLNALVTPGPPHPCPRDPGQP